MISDFVGTDRLLWWEQIAEIMHNTHRSALDLQVVVPGLYQAENITNVLPMRDNSERDYAYRQLCACIRKQPHLDIPLHMKHVGEYFDASIREQGRRYGLMNWQQLNDLVGQGFDIGGHTATHCNVVGADEALLQKELIKSVNDIEAKLDTPVESFAYPYGIYEKSSDVVDNLLARTNCKAAYTTVRGVVNTSLPANELPRIQLNRPYDFACAFNIQNALHRT